MSHDIDALNRLIGLLRAAAKSYRAADRAYEPQAAAHDRVAEALASEVRDLGGAPAEAPGFDLAHHAWSDLSAAVRSGLRAAAEALERSEAELLAEFQSALDDTRVSGPVRDAILRAFDGVKAGHDVALQSLEALGG